MLNEIVELVCFGYNRIWNCILILAFPSVKLLKTKNESKNGVGFTLCLELHKTTINIFWFQSNWQIWTVFREINVDLSFWQNIKKNVVINMIEEFQTLWRKTEKSLLCFLEKLAPSYQVSRYHSLSFVFVNSKLSATHWWIMSITSRGSSGTITQVKINIESECS